MKILDNTKTLTQLVSDTTNGLGHISPLSCPVTEVLNGEYEAELTVSANDKYFSLLSVGSLLEIELDAVRGKQIFEIYFISKPINEIVTIKAQHIAYRLNKVPVGAFSSTGAVSTVNNLLSHVIGTTEFTMTTDITNTTSNFSLDVPRYFREILGGYEGSMLDVFRGEYEWDNLTIRMLAHRGSDNGVRIAYGKNLTDFNQEENNQEVYTSVLGYAKVDGVLYTGNVYDKIVSTNQRVKIVDFSSDYESGQTPTVSELTDKAEAYATRNDIENPNVNITISFVPLYQTEEYKNIAPLERVNLGDTVHVYIDRLGVEVSSRVVKTVWNVLTQKYDSVELGSLKASLNTVLEEQKKDILETIDTDQGFVEAELNQLGSLIINGLGLFKTTETLGDGSTRIYLHNKPLLIDSNIQYYISASGLVVSTDYGQTWNAGFNPDGSAVLNALSANIIRALQIYGSYIQGSQIVFGDMTDKYIIAQPYYDNNDNPLGVSFDGTGNIRMQPQGIYDVRNLDSTLTYSYNRFVMSASGSLNSPYILLHNFDKNNNFISANFMEIDSSYYSSSSPTDLYNRIVVRNNATATGTSYSANTLLMEAYGDTNHMYLNNMKIAQNSYANRITMSASATSEAMNLQNYSFNGSFFANSLSFSAFQNSNFMTLRNYMTDAETYANSIEMTGVGVSSGSTNYLRIRNFDVDSTDNEAISGEIILSKTTSNNFVRVNVLRAKTVIGYMQVFRNSSADVRIELYIPDQTVVGHTYNGCSLVLDSSDGTVSARGSNFLWNGSVKW